MRQIFAILICFVLCFGLFGVAHAAKIETLEPKSFEEVVASHKGKIVLVNFFATWCPPCREEIPGLVSISNNMPKDVVVLGLSVDESTSKLSNFIADMQIKYPVYLTALSLAEAFKVQTIPHNLIYDKSGKLVANASGFVTEEELKKFIKALLEEDANAKSDNS